MNLNSVVTIIPQDGLISVDNQVRFVTASFPRDIHAIQWNHGTGWIEYEDPKTPPRSLGEQDFAKEIAPYINIWERQPKIDNTPTVDPEVLIRSYRDQLLSATDYYLLLDYRPNLSEDQYQQLVTYRQALRDITKHPDFPWEGNLGNVDWPLAPSFIKFTGASNGY